MHQLYKRIFKYRKGSWRSNFTWSCWRNVIIIFLNYSIILLLVAGETHLGIQRLALCPVTDAGQFQGTGQRVFLCYLSGQSRLQVRDALPVHELRGQKRWSGVLILLNNVSATYLVNGLPGAKAELPNVALVQFLDAQRQVGRQKPAACSVILGPASTFWQVYIFFYFHYKEGRMENSQLAYPPSCRPPVRLWQTRTSDWLCQRAQASGRGGTRQSQVLWPGSCRACEKKVNLLTLIS